MNIFSKGRTLFRTLIAECLLSVACLCYTACSGPTQEADLTLLYVTDVHGHLLPDYSGLSQESSTSMANFATYVNYVYNTRGKENTVLLCGGDLNDGLPLEYYYNNIARYDEHISPAVMNYLGFDAIQLGASDVYLGMDVWIGILPAQYKMPYMCANLLDNKTQIPPFPTYTIVERNGFRIAVIGLMDPKECKLLSPEDMQGLHFADIAAVAREMVQHIKEVDKPDYTVIMASSSADNEELLKIADVDLFLMGADHKYLMDNDFRINERGDSVLVVQPLSHMDECARIDIHLRKVGSKIERRVSQSQRVPLTLIEQDTAFVNHFEPQQSAVDTYLEKQVGNFRLPLKYSDALFGPSAWMDLKHDMQLWSTGADVSICNIDSEVGDIEAGTFTMRDLFHYFKSDRKLWVVPMTGAEIHSFLEAASAVHYNQMKSPNDHLLAYKYNDINEVIIGNHGPELIQDKDYYCSAAGIRYTVDVTKPAGERVVIRSMSNGAAFDENETYRVAIPDFLAMGGAGYISSMGWDHETALRRLDFHGTLSLRTHFFNFVKAQKNYTPTSRNEWKVIPTEYYEAGSKRDRQLMKRYIR